MILVTGGTGFVGSAVVRRLIAFGESVRVLVRQESSRLNLEGMDVSVFVGDVCDDDSVVAALEGCQGLFHVAADYRLWVPDSEKMYKTNIEGTRKLMELSIKAGINRVVYTSSVAVLGTSIDGNAADETTPVKFDDMIGPYKKSKYLAEEVVRELIALKGLPAVIVNPSTPIGPFDIKPTPTGQIIIKAATGAMPGYVDTGLNIVHVDDIAMGHYLAYKKGKIGERYILGGDDMTLKEILDLICLNVGRTKPKLRMPHGMIIPIAYLAEAYARYFSGREPFVTIDGVKMAKKKMFFSCTKAKRELGYAHRPGYEAISDAITWFRNNGYFEDR
ncbi:MAG: 3 beta-hydroxysteroid dehydrogenase/Delta 5--_4-isomerase [Alphaproteobacteria bacterium MarineAlpha3_Bin5]|nr:NAD-dependent dehydratase [Magnetovibrio sp.]PPR79234.1 MAG: 3 beta-hydroxysteroid dehydrogenase/Delta 5-->4-isomerase [Alphaproteobacteria bacterium MarineAlpha3_Bin5]